MPTEKDQLLLLLSYLDALQYIENQTRFIVIFIIIDQLAEHLIEEWRYISFITFHSFL